MSLQSGFNCEKEYGFRISSEIISQLCSSDCKLLFRYFFVVFGSLFFLLHFCSLSRLLLFVAFHRKTKFWSHNFPDSKLSVNEDIIQQKVKKLFLIYGFKGKEHDKILWCVLFCKYNRAEHFFVMLLHSFKF